MQCKRKLPRLPAHGKLDTILLYRQGLPHSHSHKNPVKKKQKKKNFPGCAGSLASCVSRRHVSPRRTRTRSRKRQLRHDVERTGSFSTNHQPRTNHHHRRKDQTPDERRPKMTTTTRDDDDDRPETPTTLPKLTKLPQLPLSEAPSLSFTSEAPPPRIASLRPLWACLSPLRQSGERPRPQLV